MKSGDLKPHQRAALSEILARHARFYFRLVKRMERLDWPVSDPVYQRAVAAAHAIGALKTFVDDIGKNAPAPPNTPGIVHYVDDPSTPPGRKRARIT